MTLFDDPLRFGDIPPGAGPSAAGAFAGGANDAEFLLPDEIRPTFGLIASTLMVLPAPEALVELNWISRQVQATEARLLAGARAAGASGRDTEDLADPDAKKSKTERKKARKRAAAVEDNPELAAEVENGTISPEQFDDLADADAKTGGAASKDPELMDAVRNSNSDQSKEPIRSFVNNHNGSDEETRRETQQRLRKMSRFSTRRGTKAIMAEGDDETIDNIWDLLRKESTDLYNKDGGRDLSPGDHPRTQDQRMFDAWASHFGDSSSGSGSGSGGSGGVPTIVLQATVTDDGLITDLRKAGCGPLPPSVFAKYYCNAELLAMLFDGDGQPLWQGRSYRTATRRQRLALVVRDGGCVLCRAPHGDCHAHHLLPWEAPNKGETNIDNLALVCPDCHGRIHDLKQTLYRDEITGVWKTRIATVGETPQPRPPNRPTKDKPRPKRE